MFPNLKLLLTKINLGLSFLPKVSLINEIDFVFENLRLNFLVITKSTLSLPKFSIFWFKLDNLKFFKDPVAYDLMKSIKYIIDPKNIMNPGKILI